MEASSEESEEEWEEVDVNEGGGSSVALEIVVPTDGGRSKGKRRKRGFLEKALSAFERKIRHDIHKVHLLCLLARGMLLSNQCDHALLQALMLSLTFTCPSELVSDKSRNIGKVGLLRLIKWFNAEVKGHIMPTVKREYRDASRVRISETMLLVSLMRSLGLRTRLVMACHPISFRDGNAGRGKEAESSDGRRDKGSGSGQKSGGGGSGDVSSGGDGLRFGEELLQFNLQEESLKEEGSGLGREHDGGVACGKRKLASGQPSTKKPIKHPRKEKSALGQTPNRKVTRPQSSKVNKSGAAGSDNDRDSDYKVGVVVRKRRRGSVKKTPIMKLKKAALDEESLRKMDMLGSDGTPSRGRGGGGGGGGGGGSKRGGGGGSKRSGGGGEGSGKRGGGGERVEVKYVEDTDSWVEVYISKRWMPVHHLSCSVDQPHLCERHSILPLHYVMAFESPHIVRDVTARYASRWCTDTHKHRIDEMWWEESLRPFKSDNLIEEMDENEDIYSKLSSRPLPFSIAEYKNHPLYVLKKQLLKFEAIYPETSPILGYCKGEAVYARNSVHTLHTRDAWLKEARLIRRDEKPYRVVKARAKKGQSSLDPHGNTVEVYGRWQTEEYMPPLVVEGKVPRNEYGNVEMFKPSMLPVGGAHVKIQGIQKVARKLGIDFAPAMIGWDFHGGHSHPIFNGIVVAEEFAELLTEAWETEEQLAIEKDIHKREKRVCDRWRKFVKGVNIRDRVKKKFENINNS